MKCHIILYHQAFSNEHCDNHYRNNRIFEKWGKKSTTIDKVAFVLFKGNKNVGHMIFNGRGSNNLNWFDKDKLISSSWKNLKVCAYIWLIMLKGLTVGRLIM